MAIGAGFYEEEQRMLGIEYPDAKGGPGPRQFELLAGALESYDLSGSASGL